MKTSTRVFCIDQTRAFAIFAMIMAHFGPGVFDRIEALEPLSMPLLFLGRFATTAFLLVFGLALGYVHFDRFHENGARCISLRLRWRAWLLIFCSIVISLPRYLDLVLESNFDPLQWLYASYSILNYYALALFSIPIWFRILGKKPYLSGAMGAACLWMLANGLLDVWTLDPSKGAIEYVRMHLISGPYAYLQMTSVAFLAIPIGRRIRALVNRGDNLDPVLLGFVGPAISLMVAGLGIGFYVDEFNLERIALGDFKAPPHGWYFLFFGGASLLSLVVLGVASQRWKWFDKLAYPITMFGQASLSVYVAHKFVLPAIEWSERLGIPLAFVPRVATIFVSFGLFCGIIVVRQHWRTRRVQQQRHRGQDGSSANDTLSQTPTYSTKPEGELEHELVPAEVGSEWEEASAEG